MSHPLPMSSVTMGGSAVNNPTPISIDSYEFSAAELKFTYKQINVIAFHDVLGVNLQVTGMVKIDSVTRLPMVNDDDMVYMPCPPFCHVL